MSTPNDDLAAKVGLDKGTNCPNDAYDAQHGKYADQLPIDIAKVPPPPDTNPPPFGTLTGGK